MWIKMLATAAGPDRTLEEGGTYDLPADLALSLIHAVRQNLEESPCAVEVAPPSDSPDVPVSGWVKMVKGMAGPRGTFSGGSAYKFSVEHACELVRAGVAEHVLDPAATPVQPPSKRDDTWRAKA